MNLTEDTGVDVFGAYQELIFTYRLVNLTTDHSFEVRSRHYEDTDYLLLGQVGARALPGNCAAESLLRVNV